jgi:hypothetical protein
MKVYGRDATDAFAHSPPPGTPTFVRVDDAYVEWYDDRFGTVLGRHLVLPVLHVILRKLVTTHGPSDTTAFVLCHDDASFSADCKMTKGIRNRMMRQLRIWKHSLLMNSNNFRFINTLHMLWMCIHSCKRPNNYSGISDLDIHLTFTCTPQTKIMICSQVQAL